MKDVIEEEVASTKTFFTAFEEQNTFFKAVLDAQHKFYLFAGTIRSGKSIICLVLLVILCRIFPRSRWCVIRKDIPTIKRNTLPTFFKFCCPSRFIAYYNKSDLTITFYNGSQIFFMSENYSEDPEGLRFLGLEVNGCLFEQIEECQKKTFYTMVSRTGQWIIDPMPPQLILANANPNSNWVKSVWYDPFKQGLLPADYYFQEADIRKNPYIEQGYIDLLERTWPKELLDRFLKNNWESIDEAWQLCSWENIYKCKVKKEQKSDELFLGCDVGRQGADPSLWLLLRGDNIEFIKRKDKTDIDEVYDITKEIIFKYNIPGENVCIDTTGLGAGVGDFLTNKDDLMIICFVGGSGCSEYLTGSNFKFSNLRTISHWYAAQAVNNNVVGGFTDSKLISDAGAIRYGINRDKEIYIMSKDEFRAKMHRSSDYWDVFTYAWWAKIGRTVTAQPGIDSIDYYGDLVTP